MHQNKNSKDKCERKVIKKFTLETKKLMHTVVYVLQIEPTNRTTMTTPTYYIHASMTYSLTFVNFAYNWEIR